ncbi:MAG: hypothetical protein M1817_002783 [Caeruleum heppii]|nr:MAG: hypothetical protein M1817_002783 [Caeruleum heppii]
MQPPSCLPTTPWRFQRIVHHACPRPWLLDRRSFSSATRRPSSGHGSQKPSIPALEEKGRRIAQRLNTRGSPSALDDVLRDDTVGNSSRSGGPPGLESLSKLAQDSTNGTTDDGHDITNPSSLADELFPTEPSLPSRKPQENDRPIPRLPLPEPTETQEQDRRGLISTRRDTSGLPIPSDMTPSPPRRKPFAIRKVFFRESDLLERYIRKPRPERKTISKIASSKLPPSSSPSHASQTSKSSSDGKTILLLRYASKNLVETDFRRIVPRGEHIAAWKGAGDFLQVIPGRNLETLAPLGFYLIVFASRTSAVAFRDQVRHLHDIARQYIPKSHNTRMMPPQGFQVDGEDIYTLLQSYTLVPPSHTLDLRISEPPFSPLIRRLIEDGGYKSVILRNGRTPEISVLFWVQGHSPSTEAIRAALRSDGDDRRGTPWQVRDGLTSITPVNPTLVDEMDSVDHRDGSGTEDERPTWRWASPRWIVPFEDMSEARRFMRAWHKRAFPVREDPGSADEPPPLANVELLW